MKYTWNLRGLLALLLVAAMLLGMVGCAVEAPSQPELSVQNKTEAQPENQKVEAVQQITGSKDVEELTREEKELIVNLLTDDSVHTDQMPTVQLDALVKDLTAKLEKKETEASSDDSGVYDENGAMTLPFDQAYPELVENGTVTYDDETLLIKLSNSRNGVISEGMAAAGVAALEAIVPMENATWYEAKLVDGTDAEAAIAALRELKEVLMVEYNFQIQTAQIDESKDHDEKRGFDHNEHYKDQWHLHHCGIPDGMDAMQTTGGSSSVIVAVIDTGVDYDHEDLSQNIWVNSGEIPGNNKDDDGNGYVDDYYGVDIVAGKGNGDDDNGHGTHVAGIIAAQNNNLGVVGIAYNVKIMSVKAAMASGTLNQSDIAKAILYAYDMGAEVINMSFGGSACSIAVQDALSVAYSRCVLVASAGNDGRPNEMTDKYDALPNYPAALTYVLGVMSVDQRGVESSFTNWDARAFNGVEYELYAPGSEIMSTLPGDRYGILSGTSMAAPMVSAIAAILRSEFSDRDMYPTKFIYGQLCSTSGYTATCNNPEEHTVGGQIHAMAQIVDLHAALTQMPNPEVNLHDYSLFDTETIADSNNGDGVIDAGETFALGLTLRNRWGMSKNTIVTIDTLSNAGIADPYVTIGNPSVDYGSVGTYSTQNCGAIYTDELLTGWENPFYITISKDCPNDYIIKLNVTITCENALDEEDTTVYSSTGEIWLYVRNGVVLPSVIEEDMVLTSDNLYIIPNATVINEGVTVRVEPGTHIQFWSADAEDPYADEYIAYLLVKGNFLVEGTKENPVYIYPSDLMSNYIVEMGAAETGYISLKYADVTNLHDGYNAGANNHIQYAEHCTFRLNYNDTHLRRRFLNNGKVVWAAVQGTMARFDKAVDCVFYKIAVKPYANGDSNYTPMPYGTFERCMFVDCAMKIEASYYDNSNYYTDCVFLGNHYKDIKMSYTASDKEIVIDFLQAVCYNADADTTYIYYDTDVDGYRYRYSIQVMTYYMKQLGTSYAVFETMDEAKWLNEHMEREQQDIDCYVGFIVNEQGEYVWSDGSVISSDFSLLNPQDVENGASLRFTYDRYNDLVYMNDTACDGVLYEMPGEYTTEEVRAMVQELYDAQHYNPYFHGNAILNRVSTDINVDHWLRILAPSASDYTEISLGGNYWGTTNETAIGLQMVDYSDYISYARLMYAPYLTTAPENTFPFVTSITILNKDGEAVTTVGNEPITVRVTFNRDMDTSIPLNVRFGSAEPYADYTISGSYVDARTWEGSYILNTLIENGNQYWNISNGCSATEDLELYADVARFGFVIDTTAAQALIMQGNATETGIQLTWTQDDFETLMGYNVYRSTSEDGFYQKLNSTVIPADVMEFFDDTVEPGVQYYYNFTVVKTDLTESEPSGKITIMSMDTMAPNIYHTPTYNAFTGENLIISATVTDNLLISHAKVYFRVVGESEWKSVTMTNNNSKYSAIIPAEYVTIAGIEYYIEAFDGISYTYKGSSDAPYLVTVQEAVDESSLGDVNGDGVITNLDALLLLYAINDKYNMTAEEFARADLNGDGVLTAAEALRILQYVSGMVGSVIMP